MDKPSYTLTALWAIAGAGLTLVIHLFRGQTLYLGEALAINIVIFAGVPWAWYLGKSSYSFLKRWLQSFLARHRALQLKKLHTAGILSEDEYKSKVASLKHIV